MNRTKGKKIITSEIIAVKNFSHLSGLNFDTRIVAIAGAVVLLSVAACGNHVVARLQQAHAAVQEPNAYGYDYSLTSKSAPLISNPLVSGILAAKICNIPHDFSSTVTVPCVQ